MEPEDLWNNRVLLETLGLIVVISGVAGIVLFRSLAKPAASAPPPLLTKPAVSEIWTVKLNDKVKLEMVRINAGTFDMGSPADELGRREDEVPHRVTLTRDFWLGKYEVTQTQYEAIMNRNPSRFKAIGNVVTTLGEQTPPDTFTIKYQYGHNRPVERVSWDDAMEFCRRLTDIERKANRLPAGYEYTLPTEAQWEYACRAGNDTALNSGKNLSRDDSCANLGNIAWYDPNSRITVLTYSDSQKKMIPIAIGVTWPTGRRSANAWGLYDMHGNVSEWCLDWYGKYPIGHVSDPIGPGGGVNRVHRGGCYDNAALSCRSAYRLWHAPDHQESVIGFRLALAPVR